jgi:transcriptional regulator
MPTEKSDLLPGTLDMLILKIVALGPVHGYGISLRIRQISKEVLQVQQGSLYPALHRLERRGWLDAEWGESENGRQAKFYKLSAKGRKQLAEEELNWQRLAGAVTLIMRTAE